MHADAEPQTPTLLQALILSLEADLNRHSALNRINSTWELGKHAVTSGVRNPAPMFVHEPVHDLAVRRQLA